MNKIALLSIILICFCCNLLQAQTGKYNDNFNENKGWRFADPADKDSAELLVVDGSLVINNKHYRKRVLIEYTPISGIEFNKDDEWECTVQFRHLSGVNDYEYGICLGAIPNKLSEEGLRVGISGNGYYRLSRFANKRNNEVRGWTRYSSLKTTNGEVNEIRIIKRQFNKLYVLANNSWAFSGNAGSFGGNSILFYVDAGQSIAVNQLDIKSFKGLFNKLSTHRITDLKEVCEFAVDGFKHAKGFEQDSKYKSWLAPVTYFNQEHLIHRFTKGSFPLGNKDTGSNRYVYRIEQGFEDDSSGRKYYLDEKKKLEEIIEGCFVNFDKQEQKDEWRSNLLYRCKNNQLPKGTIAWLETSKHANGKIMLTLHVMNVPDM